VDATASAGAWLISRVIGDLKYYFTFPINAFTRIYRTVKPLTMWAAAANLPSFLRFGLRGLLLLWARAACGRDDTVHPQVLDHLTVVILRMEGADNGDCETR